MSILVQESAINREKDLWAKNRSSSGGASVVAGTIAGYITPDPMSSETDYILNSVNANKGAGTYVIIGTFNWFVVNNVSNILRGYLQDTVSGKIAEIDLTVTQNNSYCSSVVLTVTTSTNVNLQQFANSTQYGNTCRGNWSVLFFPA